MTNPRKSGRIKRFSEDKGYGFIIPDGAAEQLFFHITDVVPGSTPAERARVSFRAGHSDKGPRAYDVVIETEDGKCPLCGAEKAR